MSNIYYYMRISTKESTDKQSFGRQLKAIKSYCSKNKIEYDDRNLYQDDVSGSTFRRKDWEKLEGRLRDGDTIVFKEISRFTREAENGYAKYMELMNRGINLVFLDNPTVSTDYIKKLTHIAETQQLVAKTALEGTVKLLLIVELDRVQQEREIIVKRIKDGLAASNKKAGRPTGRLDKISHELIYDIEKYLADRTIKAIDIMKKHNISRNTFKKYVKVVQDKKI